MICVGKNNVLYYKYDFNIKEKVEKYFKRVKSYKFNDTTNIELVEKLLDDYFNIYNQFNKFGIAMNKLNILEEIKYCDHIYMNFEILKKNFKKNILNRYSIENLKNSKYYYFLQSKELEIPRTDLMNKIYLEFNQSKYSTEISFEKLMQYIYQREETIKNEEFTCYLDYIKNKIGICEESFNKLLNVSLAKKQNVNLSEENICELKEAKYILIDILKKYYDINILSTLLDNVYISNKNSGTTVAYEEIPIINIKSDNNKINIITLAHELGHAYHYYCNQSNEIQNFDSRSDFSESFALATQLIVSQELKLKDCMINDYNNFFFDTIYSLQMQKFIGDNYLTLTEDHLAEKYNNYKNYYCFIFDNFYDIYYLEGFIVGNILKDKIKNYSIDELKILLGFNSNISLNEILNLFDIDLNNQKMLDIYLDGLEKEYKKLVSSKTLK